MKVYDVLVITRKIGESIIINQNISVSILSYKGNSIRIGIKAPLNIQVFREEIFKKVDEENKKAVKLLQARHKPPDDN